MSAPRVTGVTGSYPVPRRSEPRRDDGGGRFISRGRLAVSALYWIAWLSVSRRAGGATGIQREFDEIVSGALRLVLVSSVLMGLIATFQVAYQLHSWGAESISIRTIAWFGARELGPVSVALLIVARSAASIAGELASMRAGAEIDALRVMGLDPVKYLVAPKLAALLLALPALTIVADGLITLGGWLGSRLFLGFSTSYFVEQFRIAFELRDVIVGLGKSVIFAFIIVLVAADEGLNVEGRVTAIGEAATRAVIHSVILVLVADTIVNAIFYFIPGLV